MIRPLLILAAALVVAACDRVRPDLVMVRPTGVDEAIARDLVGLFDRESRVTIRLTDEAMAGGEAVLAVAQGRADLALITNDQPYRDDIATVMPLYATVLHIVRTRQKSAKSFTELVQGATVYAGEEGSASRRLFERLTARADPGDSSSRFVTDEHADIDLAMVFAPISPDRLAEFPGVSLWSIGTPDEIGQGGPIDSIVLLNPHFRAFVIPADTYGSATQQPVVTIAVDKIIVARTDLDESVVYDLIHEVLRLRPALGMIHPGLFRQVAEDFDVSRSRFIVHAGTQDYLQRSEPSFIERYSGVAEVAVTVLIALVSALIAGLKILARRRKNRIDRFYTAAIRVRDRITPDITEQQRNDAAVEVRQLQDEAFALLVDEKLAADESFRIFITLSNDVLRQLQGEPG